MFFIELICSPSFSVGSVVFLLREVTSVGAPLVWGVVALGLIPVSTSMVVLCWLGIGCMCGWAGLLLSWCGSFFNFKNCGCASTGTNFYFEKSLRLSISGLPAGYTVGFFRVRFGSEKVVVILFYFHISRWVTGFLFLFLIHSRGEILL